MNIHCTNYFYRCGICENDGEVIKFFERSELTEKLYEKCGIDLCEYCP